MKRKLLFILTIWFISTFTAHGQGAELTQEEIKKITNFELIYPFSEKLSKVMSQGKWGYINLGGETKIPLKYDDAGSFIYGVARVRQGAKFSAIDFNGKQIMPWFDYVYPFYNGLAKVKNRNDVGFVNKEGNLEPYTIGLQYISALGGVDNIKNIDNCVTRLRVEIVDNTKINDILLKQLGAKGVINNIKGSVQVVIGPEVERLANQIKQGMKILS